MNNKYINWFSIFIFIVVTIRLASLSLLPLMDTTEARYGEIARLMAETGDWITPYFDYGVPFWGKPPLSFWLSALSFKLFGVNEFTARLPSWLCGILILWLLTYAAKSLGIRNQLLPSAVTVSSLVFFVVIGGVMTEASLMLGIVLSTVAIIQVLSANKPSVYWQYIFFVGLAIGMLAKGPIALVLVGAPLVFWAIVHGQVKVLWQKLPWVSGSLLFAAISLPWYVIAELKTPGFIDYFIIGEHFNRFVIPGWDGDLYGNAHDKPYGTIWYYWLFSAAPWSLIIIAFILKALLSYKKKGMKQLRFNKMDWLLFYWAVFPQLFFTLSGNILMTYIVPGLPALALLFSRKIENTYFQNIDITKVSMESNNYWQVNIVRYTGLITPFLVVVLYIAITLQPNLIKSEKLLLSQVVEKTPDIPIYYLGKVEFSSRFYSFGRAKLIQQKELKSLEHKQAYLAISKKQKNNVNIRKLDLKKIGDNRRYNLYKVN